MADNPFLISVGDIFQFQVQDLYGLFLIAPSNTKKRARIDESSSSSLKKARKSSLIDMSQEDGNASYYW